MGSVLIVDGHPLRRDLSDLLQTSKQVEIQHFIPVRAVEPFNERVLGGTARLNVIDQYSIGFSPILQGLRQELWPFSQRKTKRLGLVDDFRGVRKNEGKTNKHSLST